MEIWSVGTFHSYHFIRIRLLIFAMTERISVWPHRFRGAGREKIRGEQ